MKNTLETRLGIFFALALVAAVVLLEVLGGHNFFKKGVRVRARFNNVQELKVGDPVRMAGVDIGRVSDIHLADNKVEVGFKINNDASVKTDSTVAIKFVGLLGQNYLAVDFGSPTSPKATADALLKTVEQADLNSLIVKLDSVAGNMEGLTKNFSGENFGNLLGPFTDFIKENSPRLSAILGNMQVISTQVAQGQGTVGKLINDPELYHTALTTVSNLNIATGDFKPLMAEAKLTLSSAREVVNEVNQGKGTIGKLIKDEALYRETTVAMTNMREILEKMNQGKGSVGKLINDDSFLKNAKMSLQKLDKATEGLEDQGPLSVLGIAVNSLF